MKRKITAVLLAGLLVFSGTGCTQSKEKEESSSTSSSSQSVMDESETETTQTPTPASGEEKERIEVRIPQKEGMQADYVSPEGIQLEPGAYIAVVAKDLSSGFWKAVKTGAQQAIDELNTVLNYTGNDKIRMTFEGTSDEDDVETQINTIDTVISENPSVLCLGIIDMDSCRAQLENAQENGIPVIIVDSGVESELVQATCGIDNRAAGAEAARKLCEAIGDSGEIGIIAHQSTTQTSVERVEGFSQEIEQNHPNVSIVQTGYTDGDQEAGAILEDMLAQHPQLKGIFCTNQQTSDDALGVLEKQETPVRMVGFDSSEEQMKAVESGLEYGTVSQNPYSLGYAMVIAAARAAAGMSNDPFIDAGYQWIDSSNMNSEELTIYQY